MLGAGGFYRRVLGRFCLPGEDCCIWAEVRGRLFSQVCHKPLRGGETRDTLADFADETALQQDGSVNEEESENFKKSQNFI